MAKRRDNSKAVAAKRRRRARRKADTPGADDTTYSRYERALAKYERLSQRIDEE
jgi:hypothetical protein